MVKLQNSGSKTFNDKGRLRILHVDDDSALQEITKLMLLDLNSEFIIDQACCVDDAFKKLSIGNYDVVVSDYEMPKKMVFSFLKNFVSRRMIFHLFCLLGRAEKK